MAEQQGRQELQKSLSAKDILALAFGTMVGWGWIMLAGRWVSQGGTAGAVIAFAIGAVLCIFVGLTYSELTPALPLAGGELVFSYRSMGYNGSWLCGWMITFAYVGVACWEGPGFMTAVDFLFGSPDFLKIGKLWTIAGYDVYFSWFAIGSVIAIFLCYLNYRGVKQAAVFQVMATLGLALGGVCFLLSGLINGDIQNTFPMISEKAGAAGIVVVLLAVPSMFVGFDVIPQAAEEMNFPLHKIPKILIFSIILAALWYMFMIVAIALSAPEELRQQFAEHGVPVANAFAHAMGHPVFGKLMILAAMCGILTSWNGFIVGATRVLFSMGRAKMLPEAFAKVHPKYNSPTAAIVLVGILSSLSPLLGKMSLGWFVDASAFGTVIAYFMVVLSFCILRSKEPDLKRPYKVPNGNLIGAIALLVSLFFIALYLPLNKISESIPVAGLDPECWYMVIGWLVLGAIFYVMASSKYKDVTLEERDYLMFGNEFTRFKTKN